MAFTPAELIPTFKSLPILLEMEKPHIQQYIAMSEAQFGALWIKRYIWYLHDLPEYNGKLLYQALQNSPNKRSAAYVASLIIAYLWRDNVLPNNYSGYRRLETAFPPDQGTIVIKFQGQIFNFTP